MNDLMSEQELEKVTGYKAQAKQCKVLTDHGIFFMKDANGTPHVTWYSFNNPTQSKTSNLGRSFWSPSYSVEE